MTIDEAVDILNGVKHGYSESDLWEESWVKEFDSIDKKWVVILYATAREFPQHTRIPDRFLTEFEAKAVASFYLQERR